MSESLHFASEKSGLPPGSLVHVGKTHNPICNGLITGVYGMNFEYMPELKWRWGYPVLWSVFIGVLVFLLVYFKKKKWL